MDSDSSDSNISFVLLGYRGLACCLFTGAHVLVRATSAPHLRAHLFKLQSLLLHGLDGSSIVSNTDVLSAPGDIQTASLLSEPQSKRI